MTAQFPDTAESDGKHYTLIGVSGAGLFEPKARGMAPIPMTTGCARGHRCDFRVTKNEIVLAQLAVHLEEGAERPKSMESRHGLTATGRPYTTMSTCP